MSRRGPDVVDVALATWSCVAVPSILFGCETIPFTNTKIEKLERIQCQVAKRVLGVPVSSPNVCTQTELGLRSLRHLLYERQLKYYTRVLHLPKERWVNRALMEHLQGSWPSPYLAYITKLRCELGMVDYILSARMVEIKLSFHFTVDLNQKTRAMLLLAIGQVESLPDRQRYVLEGPYSSWMSKFRLANAGLGNRAPRRVGEGRRRNCPLCP